MGGTVKQVLESRESGFQDQVYVRGERVRVVGTIKQVAERRGLGKRIDASSQ